MTPPLRAKELPMSQSPSKAKKPTARGLFFALALALSCTTPFVSAARAQAPAAKPDAEGFVPEARPMDMTNAAAKENIPATPLVAGAYGFIWLAVLVYVGTVAARAGRLTKEVAVLQQKLNQVDPGGR